MVLANTTIVGYPLGGYQKWMYFLNGRWLLMQSDMNLNGPSAFQRHKLCVELSAALIHTVLFASERIWNRQELMRMGPRW